jgi:hypothetical protein
MAKTKKNKKPMSWQARMFMVLGLLMAIVFLPTTTMLMVGMLPTIVCALVDRTRGMVRTMSVGAMNLSGCIPFIIELWGRGNNFEVSFDYLTTPRTVIVMYFAAAMGYLIDWAMTGIVCSVMVEKAKGRIKDIEKRHADLVKRWGEEVTGRLPLDPEGFPLEEEKKDEAKA